MNNFNLFLKKHSSAILSSVGIVGVVATAVTTGKAVTKAEKILERLKNKGIDFVVDATGNLLKNVLKYKPLMVKPNHHELGEMFSAEIKNLDDIKKYGNGFLLRFPLSISSIAFFLVLYPSNNSNIPRLSSITYITQVFLFSCIIE